MSVEITDTPWSGVHLVECVVTDPAHPGIVANFEFAFMAGEVADDGREKLVLRAARVGAPSATEPEFLWPFPDKPFKVSIVRDLPLRRWETAARNVAMLRHLDRDAALNLLDRLERSTPKETPPPDAKQRQRLAKDLLNSLYPDATEGVDSPIRMRRFVSLHRLALVAVDYQRMLAEGRSDPAAEIARRDGVTPSTVRSWIHRARKAGFLGPAYDRTAGVAADDCGHDDDSLDISKGVRERERRRVARREAVSGTADEPLTSDDATSGHTVATPSEEGDE